VAAGHFTSFERPPLIMPSHEAGWPGTAIEIYKQRRRQWAREDRLSAASKGVEASIEGAIAPHLFE